jgi:hypothetical protein
MKPFHSREEMLYAHELMFGDAGRRCAEIVLYWATTRFAAPLDVLTAMPQTEHQLILAPFCAEVVWNASSMLRRC